MLRQAPDRAAGGGRERGIVGKSMQAYGFIECVSPHNTQAGQAVGEWPQYTAHVTDCCLVSAPLCLSAVWIDPASCSSTPAR